MHICYTIAPSVVSGDIDYTRKLERVMALDENIRFAAVSDMEGTLITFSARNDKNLYLSPEDTQDTLRHAATAWKSRMKHYDKIGKGLYTLAVYEKLRRVTIPLKSDHLLLVTIDSHGGQKQIVDKILNEVIVGDYTGPTL